MGSSNSRLSVKNVLPASSSQRYQVDHPDKIDQQLKATREEVGQQKPLITENVIQELLLKEDTMVLRYSELKDASEIATHIEEIFKDEHAVQFLTDAAEKMVTVFHSSKEMKEMLRWNQVKKIMRCGDMTVGMELHYKVVVTEENVRSVASLGAAKTETVVILGYKFIQHALDFDPEKLPNDDNLRALRF